jgi:1-acyl-sn-glycerol-3-phosphate acyltransferase
MGMVDSLRALAEMARASVPSAGLLGLAAGRSRSQGIGSGAPTVDDRAREFGRRVVELLDVKLAVAGGEQLDPRRAYVFLSNQQSQLDIPILYAALPAVALRMIARTDRISWPWLRWLALGRAELIEIDRRLRDRDRAQATVRSILALVRAGVSVWIAPEVERSRDGTVRPLDARWFHLAAGTGAAIVPVAIRGSADIVSSVGVVRRGIEVHVEIGAPIETADRSVPELMAVVAAFLHRHVEVN